MNAPEEIHGVSQGYFSIARHYGGIVFQGQRYTYFPAEDKLVRDDVLKRRKKEARAAKAAQRKAAQDQQKTFTEDKDAGH